MTTGVAPKPGESSALKPWLVSLRSLPRIGIIIALMLTLYTKVLADMARDWWNEPAWSQGLLLPPLALYMAWIQRQQTLRHAAAIDVRGVLFTGFACCMFLVGELASEFFMMRISFVLLLAGLIWTFWGLPRLRSLAFPIVLLATMVPLPALIYNSLAAPLQLFASDLATRIAQEIGISVLRDGNVIHLASISLGVAEACSGLHSLSALLVAGLLLGYLYCRRFVSRLMMVVFAIPIAIGFNVVRVAGTAILADYSHEFAMGFYHSFSGWLVFLAGFATLWLASRTLRALADRSR